MNMMRPLLLIWVAEVIVRMSKVVRGVLVRFTEGKP